MYTHEFPNGRKVRFVNKAAARQWLDEQASEFRPEFPPDDVVRNQVFDPRLKTGHDGGSLGSKARAKNTAAPTGKGPQGVSKKKWSQLRDKWL